MTTRDNEIKQHATDISNTWIPQDYQQVAYDAAVKMAEWVDQHPKKELVDIKKVEQWIISCFEFLNEAGNHNFKIDKFIDNFHRAMEE